MLFCDLLRLTVLLNAALATALAAVTVLVAGRNDDPLTLVIAGGWWAVAVAAGLWLGRSSRAGEGVARALASARTTMTLPTEDAARVAVGRLWPLGASALAAGGLAFVWPQVAAIASGYSLLWALAWRSREAAVTSVEDRDGVRFYVEPGSAFQPLTLVRTPGLGSDRTPPGHPPPPPPAGE